MFGVLDIDDERARRAAYCSSKAVFSGVGPVRPPRLLDAFSGGTPAPTPENGCSQEILFARATAATAGPPSM